ncbi:MAG TPA: hypothetical protein VLG47_02510 [Candidatus Saccharimonadales bacterium]|nr:hypothetical protein [Candidatus Saccharimonadales bacterium]
MRKNQKGFTVVEGLIILAVVLLIGGITWFFIDKNNSESQSPDDVLAIITKDANSTFSNVNFEKQDSWSAEASATAYNTVPGYDFKVSSVGKGIWFVFDGEGKPKTIKKLLVFHKTIPPAASLKTVQGWVGSELTMNGFTTKDGLKFTKGGTTCEILNDPESLFPNIINTDAEQNSNLMQVSCFGPDVLRSAAAQMNPFVEEYIMNANPSVPANDISAGPLTIKSQNGSGVIGSSRTAGYDIAEMVVTTKTKKQIALYYAKNADIGTGKNGGWHYVTQANDEFGFKCGDMKANPDSRKAFYDQVCLSAQGQVRLDTNNRALQ